MGDNKRRNEQSHPTLLDCCHWHGVLVVLFCVIGVVRLSGCRAFPPLPLVLSSLLLFVVSLILRVVSPPFLLLIVISALLLLPLLLFLSFASFPLVGVVSPMSGLFPPRRHRFPHVGIVSPTSSSCPPRRRFLLLLRLSSPSSTFLLLLFVDSPPLLLHQTSSSSLSNLLFFFVEPLLLLRQPSSLLSTLLLLLPVDSAPGFDSPAPGTCCRWVRQVHLPTMCCHRCRYRPHCRCRRHRLFAGVASSGRKVVMVATMWAVDAVWGWYR